MNRNNKRKGSPKQQVSLRHLPDDVILVEAAFRRGSSLNELIKPSAPSPAKVSLEEWKLADMAAQNVDYPNRNLLYRVYDNVMIDLFLTSLLQTIVDKAKQAKYNLVGIDGKPNKDAKKLLEDKTWFKDFISNALKLIPEGYTLIEIYKFNEEGELTCCDVVNKYHVKPEKGIVTKDQNDETGTDYLSGNTALYYIPVGKVSDFGLLRKIAPSVLAKKYAIGQWGELNEKLGIPFRYINSPNIDAARQKQLGIILEKSGSAGWAVLNENEKLQLLEMAKTDPSGSFEKFIALLDAQVAMAINGESSTANSSKEKGTYGSLEVLKQISDLRMASVMDDLKALINDVLLPRLITISPFYASLKGLKLNWDYSKELTVDEFVTTVATLVETGHYYVNPETISKTVGFEVLPVQPGQQPKKSVQVAKKKSLNLRISSLYKGCCDHDKGFIAADTPNFDDDIARIAKDLFDGKHNGVVDIPLMKKTAEFLRKGIMSGYTNSKPNEAEQQLRKTTDKNIYVFSGFKTYQQLQDMSAKLRDENGNLRNRADFFKEVLKVDNTYNKVYLRPEYEHAVTCGQMIDLWADFQRNKDVLGILQFDAVGDNRTTPICLSLDGFTARVDDPAWLTIFLPLHFGERSTIRAVASAALTDQSKINFPDVQPMFKNNVGISGIVFPESHPYYEASKADSKEILKSVDKVYQSPADTKVVYSKNGKELSVNSLHNKFELKENTRFGKIIVDNGHDVELPAYSFEPNVKNPDAIIDKTVKADFKGMEEPSRNAAFQAIRRAGKQDVAICVLEPLPALSVHDLKEAIVNALGNSSRRKSITELWLVYKKEVVKITRKEIYDMTFVGKLK